MLGASKQRGWGEHPGGGKESRRRVEINKERSLSSQFTTCPPISWPGFLSAHCHAPWRPAWLHQHLTTFSNVNIFQEPSCRRAILLLLRSGLHLRLSTTELSNPHLAHHPCGYTPPQCHTRQSLETKHGTVELRCLVCPSPWPWHIQPQLRSPLRS